MFLSSLSLPDGPLYFQSQHVYQAALGLASLALVKAEFGKVMGVVRSAWWQGSVSLPS